MIIRLKEKSQINSIHKCIFTGDVDNFDGWFGLVAIAADANVPIVPPPDFNKVAYVFGSFEITRTKTKIINKNPANLKIHKFCLDVCYSNYTEQNRFHSNFTII